MRPARSLLIYTGIVFLGGALLAPWLYWTFQWLAALLPAFRKLADNPFHRYVNRSLLALALTGLWPLLRSLGVRGWQDVGLAKPAASLRHWPVGFASPTSCQPRTPRLRSSGQSPVKASANRERLT